MSAKDEVRGWILEFLSRTVMQMPTSGERVSDTFDLRLDGGLDSLGFLRLVAELERRSGGALDLADLDPAHLTRLGPLAAHVAGQIEERHVSR